MNARPPPHPTPPFSPPNATPHRPSSLTRRSIDAVSNSPLGRMQAERNAAMPMPVGNRFPTRSADNAGMPLRMAASPPKNKNTQHVPCKFFLQGQCQAGAMCPFSHDIESTTRPAQCKYFAKGGCKFGRKCALLHVTQDGTVVNRHHYPPPPPPPPQYMPAALPHMPGAYAPPPPGLLSMQAQGLEQRPNGDGPAPDFEHYQYGPRSGYEMPQQIDMTYTSASPKYGSPPQNERTASSPPQKGLSVLDAPLPNSFDSNGVSWAAMHGQLGASMPARFNDVDSPPSSLPRKAQLGNTALRDLHSSAFGDRGMDNLIASMGSSPPSGTDEPLKFEKRPLHSDRLRASRVPMMSASLGTRSFPTRPFEYSDEDDDDDDDDADREEDLLPSSLHDLIPEGRPRKASRSRTNDDSPATFLAAQRRTISNHGTPAQDSKVGSPHSSSPSRYTAMFARNMRGDSSLAHVGSPLRDSSLPTSHPAGLAANGELSPSISSPPRQASMSMLTQELQRTRLDAARSASSSQPPAPVVPQRTLSNGSARASIERNVSSNSISQRIDEEQELFDMDFDAQPKANGVAPTSSPARSAWDGKNETAKFGPIGGGRATK
ncbi:hypothetical protein AC578_2695 [Pseudocercospora eumusae]|uniref:C3H1-type domain-containing protein n=1 Tax=Pseudocercospora eumusae TaxID=321146 RepID=A0A139HFV5_9PEZI|nr:hypothetical protein AC578_2695 [Pseudocercospora eumusae]